MDEHSYDGTEQTPQPKMFRPPPMHPSTSSSGLRGGGGSNGHNNRNRLSLLSTVSSSSRRLAQEASAVLNNVHHSSIFSFDNHGGGTDETTSPPSLPPTVQVPPPSPISHLGGGGGGGGGGSLSLLGEDELFDDNSRFDRQPERSQPAVRVEKDTEEEDVFFACLQDDGLAQRTRRSLGLTPPSPNMPNSNSTLENDQDRQDRDGRRPMSSATTSSSTFDGASLVLSENSGGGSSSYYMEEMDHLHGITPTIHTMHQHHPQNINNNNPSPLQVSRLHESALQALMRLKDELLKSNDRNKILVQENELLLASQQQVRMQERKEWEAKLKTANDRHRKEFLHLKLASDNRQKEVTTTLKKLQETQKMLQETTLAQTQLAHDYSVVTREKQTVQQENILLNKQLQTLQEEAHENYNPANINNTVARLQEDLGKKDQEIANFMNTTRRQYEEEVEMWKQKYEAERTQHKANVDQRNAEMIKMKSHLEQKTNLTPRNGGGSNINNSVRFQDLDSSVADRLARMRDSAERAHLIQAHKRDMARLKMDHEEKVQKLLTCHQEALRKAQKHADAELTARMDEMKKSLKEESEEQLKDATEQQREKIAEIQKELMRHQETADESLHAALTKISNLTQQYEREVNKRASLEMLINQMNHERDQERDQSQARHSEDLAKRRAEWEMERDTLLTLIHRDCNSAFEHHRWQPYTSSPLRSSPKGVDTTGSTGTQHFFSSGHNLKVQTTMHEGADFETPVSVNLVSPAYSDIDDVLRETEDLIQSIM